MKTNIIKIIINIAAILLLTGCSSMEDKIDSSIYEDNIDLSMYMGVSTSKISNDDFRESIIGFTDESDSVMMWDEDEDSYIDYIALGEADDKYNIKGLHAGMTKSEIDSIADKFTFLGNDEYNDLYKIDGHYIVIRYSGDVVTLIILITKNQLDGFYTQSDSDYNYWGGETSIDLTENNQKPYVYGDISRDESNDYDDFGYDDYEEDNYYGDYTNEYILPDSGYMYYSIEDIYGLTEYEARIARNEIYARHGRLFKDSELQEYFDNCSWYYGYIEPDEFEESMLNDYERENTKVIKEYEKLLEN